MDIVQEKEALLNQGRKNAYFYKKEFFTKVGKGMALAALGKEMEVQGGKVGKEKEKMA